MTLNSVNISHINSGSLQNVDIQAFTRLCIYTNSASLSLETGESLREYKAVFNGETFRPNGSGIIITGGMRAGENTLVITAYGRDAENNDISSSLTYTYTAYSYDPPAATYTVIRTDEDGYADVEGGYLKATCAAEWCGMDGHNPLTTHVYMRRKGSSQWLYQGNISDNGNLVFGDGEIRSDRSYEFLYSYTDAAGFGSEANGSIESQFWSMRFSADGHGVSFGLSTAESGKVHFADGVSLKMGDTELTEAQLASLIGLLTPVSETDHGEKTLLWTNSDDTATFAAQTVTINLSGYDRIAVLMKCANNIAVYSLAEALIDGKQFAAVSSSFQSTNYTYKRAVTATANNVSFGNGYRNTAANAAYMIPVKIWGVS